jgi:multimeric flavodoxin WrbA
MRLLILQSSYRPHGNTARLDGLVSDALRARAAQTGTPLELETLDIARMDIRPCRGCRQCFDRGEEACPLKDDLPAIASRMSAADGILFASPVYVGDINGAMKTLLDRLAYLCHRPALAGKSAAFLVTTGGSPTGHAMRTLQVVVTWGLHLVGGKGMTTGALMPDGELARAHRPAAERLATRLFDAVQSQAALRPAWAELMMFALQQRIWGAADPATLDWRYWADQGWLVPRCTFYIPHRAGWQRVATARLVGRIIARFVD